MHRGEVRVRDLPKVAHAEREELATSKDGSTSTDGGWSRSTREDREVLNLSAMGAARHGDGGAEGRGPRLAHLRRDRRHAHRRGHRAHKPARVLSDKHRGYNRLGDELAGRQESIRHPHLPAH